ncbi:hypothetical protein G5T42_09785 [Microbacterium sp. 4R-513]|uniref:hypothetical protein n=1 Tax=Microbacterium sp. 4R-513 TaxID=2567934 RepID=UPI0013E117E2|nr:hypothetical protein [Microbacterium sp. 4R-513]QIG39741.1 hypothetical protein G5T42_09785 [Microbacterium sp. 4R-513]
MKARLVDERDALWEANADGFRVSIFRAGERVETFDLDTPNVVGALDWANELQNDEAFELFAKVSDPSGGVGLVLLLSRRPGATAH